MRKTVLISRAFFLLLLLPISCPAFYFRLDGDQLWLEADRTPLIDILGQFARAGVEVRLDPRIQATVSGSVRGMDLDQALEKLLETHDYLLTWRVLRGPLGRVPKLEQIQVFLPGGKAETRALPVRSPVFDATRGVRGSSPEFVKDELLITVRSGTTYARFRRLLDEIGGMIVDADAATGVYLIRFPPGTNVEALLEQIARNPLVAGAELNLVTRLPRASASAGRPALPPVTPPADGSVPVAVLDSGLDPAAGLSGLVSAGWDAIEPERPLADALGHGTQMALLASGLLAADGLAGTGDLLPLVSIRAFDDEGKTSNFAILQALAYAEQAGARVVNLSWGSETDSDFMRAAIQSALARGLMVVAAAGNQPSGRPVYPAAYPGVVAVAGVAADGRPWADSNRGGFVDLSAPAAATFPVGHDGPAGAYVGTSISSAAVAHALAQYLNRNPGATAAAALAALNRALSPAPAAGFGAGVLDAAALERFLAR